MGEHIYNIQQVIADTLQRQQPAAHQDYLMHSNSWIQAATTSNQQGKGNLAFFEQFVLHM